MRTSSAGRSNPTPAVQKGVTQNGSLKIGASGDGVSKMQNQLKAAGFDVKVDGKFGPKTKAAVEAYQQKMGLPADGVWGKKSAAAKMPAKVDSFGDGAPATSAKNMRATFETVKKNGMASGKITVNGHVYNFNSGGRKASNPHLPAGQYTVSRGVAPSQSQKSMKVDGFGFKFNLSDKFDPSLNRTRTALRIHPDGLAPGTEGCIGVVGDKATQRQFQKDMEAELTRNGGHFTLQVG
jgi:peptidoglycan hydrolase-like protein with peptidoglycan-binding domain